MRGPVVLTTMVLAAVFLLAGVALAANVKCDGGPCRGTNKADRMTGSQRVDKMSGRGNQDRMVGNRGNDVMRGGSGADTMDGGYGSDRMSGGPGNEMMSGGPVGDRMIGGTGTDQIFGNNGNDYINVAGDAANDFFNCGTGNEDTAVVDAQEAVPADLIQFVAETDCENRVIR